MAYDFSMQLNIQTNPANLGTVVKQIESAFGKINIGKNVDPRSFVKVNSAIQQTSKQLDLGQKKADSFWNTLEGKARSSVAYTAVSTALLKITGAISQATREAVKYETELLKISQVTGDSVKVTQDYSNRLVDISKKYNVTLSKVAQLTRTLTQTGLSFKEAAKGADILAKTSLLATFDSLTSTTEGLIAVMNTFEISVSRAGQVLESINTVSKKFAVESSDIVEAIRRTGGAFSSAGGSVEELIALFTSVRSTSRESAETIATGFRTIFGRLQRPKTIEYFKQLGAQLETAEGQFVGPYEAIRRISEALQFKGIQAGSTKFAEVVEQIGGIRQISRVVPLLVQFEKTQRALGYANNASADSIEDVEKAQKGLGFQLGQLQKEFGALISDVVNSPSFKFFADVFINVSKAVLRLVSSLKPLLPILASVAAFKLGRGLTKLLSGGFSLKGAKEAVGFATGGMVPGSGNSDTVPAMLTPGEFVIRKSAVQAYGASNLAKINKYAEGGPVTLEELNNRQGKSTISKSLNDKRQLEDSVIANLNRQQINFGDNSIDWKGLVKRTDEIYQPLKQSGEGSRAKNKKNAFYAAAKAFEESVQKITGGELSEDPDAPVDIVNGKQNIEVKFTKQMTNFKDLVSKLYRQKFLTNSLPNTFTTGKDDGVDIGDLTVMEMGEGEKAKFQEWYGKNKAGILKKAMGGIIRKSSGSLQAMFDKDSSSQGQVDASSIGSGLYAVTNSQVTGGGGRALYDAVMEMASEKGSKLVSDRSKVSREALTKIWGNYFSKGVGADGKSVKKTPVSPESMYLGSFFNADDYPEENPSTWKGEALPLQYAYQKFAEGGGVGTDTVPALLTPGEFVINKRSAEAFGYNKLNEINKYAQGGFVDGLKVQRFKKGGTSKADRGGVSEERRKQLKEEARAKSDKEAGGTGLTRQETFDAGKATKSLISLAKEDITAKYQKLLDEERAMLQEQYKKRAAQIEAEGGSALEIFQKQQKALDEYNAILAEAKAGFEGSAKAELEGESGKIEKEVTGSFVEEKEMAAAKEAEAAEKAAKALEDAGKETKSFADKIKSGASSTYDAFANLNVSFPEAITQVQSFASGLKAFGGFDINQEALTQGQVKGGMMAGASEAVGRFADPKVIQGFGSQLNKVGKMLPKAIGGPVRKLGGVLLKNGANIAKGAAMAAKGLNVLSYIELGGGLVDALFSTDYGKQRDQLIQLGDAAGAATAAAQAYSQEQYRAIPIIGGFLSAMGFGSNATEEDLDQTGRLVVANARLEASLNGVDRQVNEAKEAFQRAASVGDEQGQKDAINAQLDAIDTIKKNADESFAETKKLQASGAASMGSGSSMVKGAIGGAVGGAAIGAAIGSVFPVIGTAIGTGVGLLVGAAAGATAAWWSSSKLAKEQIIKGYELQGEAAKKHAEMMSELIEGFTGNLASESARMIRGGKGYAEALEKVTDDFGGEAQVKRLLGGQQLTGDLETDINSANEAADARDAEVMRLKQQAVLLKDSETQRKAELEAQIATAEGEAQKTAALRDGLVQTQAAIIKEKQLEERRQIQAKAMEYQIALMKEMTTAYDGFNASLREASNLKEEMDNIGTNKLTTRQAAQMSGVQDARVYEMDAEEIVRNKDVADQMATRVGVNTMRGQEILKGQERVKTIDRIQSDVVNTGALKDIYANVQEGETADAKQIQDAIYEKLGLTEGADPVLDEEIRKYSESIAKDGLTAAAEAAQAARAGATAKSKEIIEEQQRKDKELFDAQKDLRNMEIELSQKLMAVAKEAYDNEKDYFDKRLALSDKVNDVLNPVKEGPGKAQQLAARGEARAKVQRDALNTRRSNLFASEGVGLKGMGLEEASKHVIDGFNAAGEASEQLKNGMNALLTTVQDEIDVEQDYLDSLIETAKAQQEYTQALNDAQGSLVRDLVTGTEEEVGNQLNTMNAAAMAASQGSFAGIPEEMKKDIFALFDQFGDIEIPGLGMTGRDAQREITKNELMQNFGYDEATASKLASKAVQDKVPIDQKMAEQIKNQEKKIHRLLEIEKNLKLALNQQERENVDIFAKAVEEFRAIVARMQSQAGNQVAPAAQAAATNNIAATANVGGNLGQQAGQALGGSVGGAIGNVVGSVAGAVAPGMTGLIGGLSQMANNATGGALGAGLSTIGGMLGLGGGGLNTQAQAQAQANMLGMIPSQAQVANQTQTQQPLPTYGLTPSQQRYAEDKINLKKQQQELLTKRESEGLTPEEKTKLSKTSNALQAANKGLFDTNASRTDVELYQQAYQARQNEMQAADQSGNRSVTPNNGSAQQPPSNNNQAPNNQNNAPSNNTTAATGGAGGAGGGQQQPIQIQTQGQQEITVRLPDIQALVNQQITALVFETVGNKFNQVAQDVRSADNFEDVANALSGGVSETTQQQV